MNMKKLIIGITGASGAIYGVRLLEVLKDTNVETHLVVSGCGEKTLSLETNFSVSDLQTLADFSYGIDDFEAPIASGSFQTDGMIVAPCSMKTLAEIANGLAGSLLTRAADVVLKERRRLVLMTRETPLHAIHLQNMQAVTACGGIIAPPLPAFYQKPGEIDDIVNDSVGRILGLFGLETGLIKAWSGPATDL